MAAAVADFRPTNEARQTIKRVAGVPQIDLRANPDILLELGEAAGKKPKVIVGFAAESNDLIENAKQKLKAKDLDLIVANNIASCDAGFEVDTNRVVLLDRSGKEEELPLMGKDEVARIVVERAAAQLAQK
jgi:phosphopantothenoylcysteine decarboxylase/phosphopantothenate--cysteine ligase